MIYSTLSRTLLPESAATGRLLMADSSPFLVDAETPVRTVQAGIDEAMSLALVVGEERCLGETRSKGTSAYA